MSAGTQNIGGMHHNSARMTAAEYLKLPQKKAKYRNVKTFRHGIKFDSRRQADHYDELLLREKDGALCCIECEPVYEIIVNGMLVCRVKPDFRYLTVSDPIKTVVSDVKSPVTRKNRAYRIKKKLMMACLGIDIVEVL